MSKIFICALNPLRVPPCAGNEIVDIDADEQDRAPTPLLVHCHLMSTLLEAHVFECGVQFYVLVA